MHYSFDSQMAQMDYFESIYASLFSNGKELCSYRAGLVAGYTKVINEEIKSSHECEEHYTDGMMVGIGISSKDEYESEINRIDKLIKEAAEEVSKSKRKSLKKLSFGVNYSMGRSSFPVDWSGTTNTTVDYSVLDAICTAQLEKALSDEEKE